MPLPQSFVPSLEPAGAAARPRARARSVLLAAGLAAVLASLGGCGLFERATTGDKVDYKSSVSTSKRNTLEVPPDLTQLSNDSRYQMPGAPGQAANTVSASSYRAATATASTASPAVVAPSAIGDFRIERNSDTRWLHTSLTPEQLWPQLKTFWTDRGFTLATDRPEIGVMETDWAENRAKLPNDFIRNTIGKVLDSIYSTGERDRFRTRVERTATGTDIYITHRGMEEVYSNQMKDQTIWQPRAEDPQLEAEFLSRMMIALGRPSAPENVAQAASGAASAAVPPLAAPRARVVSGLPGAALQVDEKFDRAWRGVGLALDRSGFTIEDRDRTQGLYYVRYVDPATAGKEGPNFFARLFSFGKKRDEGEPVRYRVLVKEQGESSTVTVQDANGAPENGEAGKRIVAMLVDDLK